MNKIVGKIRKITQEIIDSSLSAQNYEQPDENFQEENIKELMDNGIEIVVVNAPAIITDSPSTIMTRPFQLLWLFVVLI